MKKNKHPNIFRPFHMNNFLNFFKDKTNQIYKVYDEKNKKTYI